MFYKPAHAPRRVRGGRGRVLVAVVAAAGSVAAAALGGISLASAAGASTPTNVTGVTWLPDNGDSGNGSASGGIWADDAFHRTLTVTDSTACTTPLPATFSCYQATVSDTGVFKTRPGNGLAPNPNSTTDPGVNIAWPPVTGKFSGSAVYVFEADQAPAVANIPNVVDNSGSHVSSGLKSTTDWFVNAFSSSTHYATTAGAVLTVGGTNDNALQNTWQWTYTTYTGATATTTVLPCETWFDFAGNGAGDTALDGNVTGKQCAGSPIPVPMGNYGDEVNPFGNGFDVFQQHYAPGAIVAGWTATQADPATHFILISQGSNWQFEATRGSGQATGLCVSDPGGGWASDPLRDGLILTHCNNGPFQQFKQTGDVLVNVATGLVVSPNGTGAQLRGTTSAVPWGGSDYGWQDYSHLPG